MSIKIWTAYRLKRSSELWGLVSDIHREGRLGVAARMRARLAKDGVWGEFRSRVKEGMESPYENYYDFACSVDIRERRGRLYLIPFCGMGSSGVLDFLGEDGRLEDYHWQNQTDRPESIGAREWGRRRKVWMSMLYPDEVWREKLTLVVCDRGTYLNQLFNLEPV